jgi:hypothetical protein
MYCRMGRVWLILACIEPVVEPTGKARSRNQSDKPNKVRAKSKLEAGFRRTQATPTVRATPPGPAIPPYLGHFALFITCRIIC